MRMVDCQQGSEEWFAKRAGRPTASQFDKLLQPARQKRSTSWHKYIAELIGECFDHTTVEFEGNMWTDRGNELEPEARQQFTQLTGLVVEEVGFCTQENELVGCSPDGLIRGADGRWSAGLEIKCPGPAQHVETWHKNPELLSRYKNQVHGGMVVTGLKTWHFFSYHPNMNPVWITVYWDEYTDLLSQTIDEFVQEYRKIRQTMLPYLQIPELAEVANA